jgi:hypothetical protein
MPTDLTNARALIYSVDLSAVLKRLIFIEGWKPKQAKAAIQQYRNYLFLKVKYRSEYEEHELPPSFEIDEVWHAHILHTKDYVEFCNRVFNEYLHHSPHHGQDKGISLTQLSNLFQETQRVYSNEFGEFISSIKRIPFRKRPTEKNLSKLLSELTV